MHPISFTVPIHFNPVAVGIPATQPVNVNVPATPISPVAPISVDIQQPVEVSTDSQIVSVENNTDNLSEARPIITGNRSLLKLYGCIVPNKYSIDLMLSIIPLFTDDAVVVEAKSAEEEHPEEGAENVTENAAN